MTLHDRIMNLPTGKDCPEELPARLLYTQGYRDARHASAEISLEADELMAEMAETLEELRDCDRNDKSAALSAHKSILESLDNYNTYKERRQ